MILSKEVIIKPNNHSVNHYISKGYDAKCRIALIVKVEDLTNSSNVRIDCKCEKCGSVTNLKYQDYNICISRNNFYVCEKCKVEKIKITKKDKYGCENYSNSKKRKETMNILYGCDVPLQNKEILNKKNDTCIKKYGFKNASENDKVINKIRDSHIELFKNIEYKDNITEKRRETCIEKYGVNSYTKTEEHKRKTEEYCLKKYGYKHFGSVPELILKRRESMLKKNLHRSEYFLYKRKVVSTTRRYLKTLFENWDGYDYYDNEYIKDNFNLNLLYK